MNDFNFDSESVCPLFQITSQQQRSDDPITSPGSRTQLYENELLAMKHVNRKLFIFGMRIIIIVLILFLFVLLFVILPVTQMGDEYNNAWDAIRSWSSAFLYSGRTLGMTALAILISDFVKKAYFWGKNVALKEVEY